MKKEFLKELQAYQPNQIEADIILSANESKNYLYKDGYLFDKDTAKYPEANADSLRMALAKKWNLHKDNFIIGNGSTELLELIVKTYVNPSENVLTFSPSFSMYDIYAKIYNSNIVKVPIDEDGTMDITKFLKTAKKVQPKVTFLCTPNNPTGGMLSRKEVITVLDNCPGIIVVDEAYMDFAKDSETVIDLVNAYHNVIVARTFSKAYGLASMRLGYAISNKTIINDLLSIKLPYNVNQFSIEVGKNALKKTTQVQVFMDNMIARRELFLSDLKALNLQAYPSYGNFIYIKSKLNLYDILLEKHILIRSFKDDSYRITVGSSTEMDNVINAIKEAIV